MNSTLHILRLFTGFCRQRGGILLLSLFWIFCPEGCKQKEPLPEPIADFSYTPGQNLEAPVTITFMNNSQNADSFEWDFDDGTGSTLRNPVKRFTKGGTYTVTLTAKGGGGTRTAFATIVIEENLYGGNNGKIGFWSKIGNEGFTSITINTGTQTLKSYWAATPDCTNGSLASFTLPAGDYSFVAVNDEGRRWKGSIRVTRAQCALWELKKEEGIVSLPSGAVIRSTATSRSGQTIRFTLDIAMVNGDNSLSGNLSRSDFSIGGFSSNGVNYSFVNEGIQVLSGGPNVPYSASLLLDQSGSISGTDPQNHRIEAAKVFCQSLGQGDNVHLSAFASAGKIPYELTVYGNGFNSNGSVYLGTLDNLKNQIGGGTPLCKSTYSMIDYVSKNAPNQNKALVVFTDGEDTGGGRTPDDIIKLARQLNIKVFMMGLGTAEVQNLAYIANQTGGAFMFAREAPQLMTMFGSLGKLLNGTANYYRTSWTMTRSPGVGTSGSYWVTSSVQVKIGGRTVFVPFRVDY
ncbi:VWA domain-containing protein [Runella slithyformis]|nr:VWA domain-containing protein [Runella slithyformis]